MGNELYFRENAYQNLISTTQTVTNTWADLGPLFQAADIPAIALWLKYTINDSTGIQIRTLSKRSIDDTEDFSSPILATAPSLVSVDEEIFQLPDKSISIGIPVPISSLFRFMRIQIKATIPGATPAAISLAQIFYAGKGYTV